MATFVDTVQLDLQQMLCVTYSEKLAGGSIGLYSGGTVIKYLTFESVQCAFIVDVAYATDTSYDEYFVDYIAVFGNDGVTYQEFSNLSISKGKLDIIRYVVSLSLTT